MRKIAPAIFGKDEVIERIRINDIIKSLSFCLNVQYCILRIRSHTLCNPNTMDPPRYLSFS